MRALMVLPRSALVAAAVLVLVAATTTCDRSTCACDRGKSAEPVAMTSPAASRPRSPPADARPHFVPADSPWRRSLDETIRRLERGDPPARIAEIFGSVTPNVQDDLQIATTLPGTSHASLAVVRGELSLRLRMRPLLRARDLEAGVGPCEEFALPDRAGQLICPSIETRSGTMDIRGFIDGVESEDSEVVVDSLEFRWYPATPPPGAPPPP